MVSPSGEANWEMCSRAIFAFWRLPVATCCAHENNKWIKNKPRSSDCNSLIHGYGDPKLGENDVGGEKNWRGDEVTDDDPSS